MSIAPLFSFLKYFGPKWFNAIAEESQHAPATIAGLAFVWLTIILFGGYGVVRYSEDAQAAEARFATMQTLLTENTKELECAKQDRGISSKTREIANLKLLTELSKNEGRRDLDLQMVELERQLSIMERRYELECL